MKIIVKIIFFIVILLAINSCSKKTNEDKENKSYVLRIASSSVTDPEIYYIKDNNLLRKYGLRNKVEYVIGGNNNVMLELFLNGKIDVATFGDLPAVKGWVKGVDIKVVAAFPRSRRDTWIMVADSQKIKTMQDLKGKKISVQIGSSTQFWLFLSLAQSGMKVTDVKMVNVPGGDASVALMNKEIDAAVMSEPAISLLEERKIATKLKKSVCNKANAHLLLISGDLYRNHPEAIKPIIAAFWETNAWIIDHPEKTVKLVGSKIIYKDIPKNVLKRQYSLNLSKVKYLGLTDSIKQNFNLLVDFLKELKAVPLHGTIADSVVNIYDTRFVDEYYREKAQQNHVLLETLIKSEQSVSVKR